MNTHPARGMRDFLPDDVRRRQYVIGVIADVYQRYGFEPLETPAVENIETLMGKYGEEGDRLIFRILKRGEEGKTRRGRSGAALRPHRAAGARRRRVPRAAAEVLQALSGAAGVARRPAAEGPLPRVLPVRRRRHRVDVDGGRGRAAARPPPMCSSGSGFATSTIRLNHRELLRGDARRAPACRPSSTATRWSRSTSSTRSAATASRASSSERGDRRRRCDAAARAVRDD